MIAVIYVIVILIGYQTLVSKPVVSALFSYIGLSEDSNRVIIFNRISGFVVLGISCVYADHIFHFACLSSAFEKKFSVILLTATLLLTIIISWLLTKIPAAYKNFPQLKFDHWDIARYVSNTAMWGAYLFSYEWLWRGIFMKTLIAVFNLGTAVSMNIIFYFIFHIIKSRGEAVASIPFGIMLCTVSVVTENFLLAFMLHLSMAIVFEAGCLFHRERILNQNNNESIHNRSYRLSR
jgi:hypothetical protein